MATDFKRHRHDDRDRIAAAMCRADQAVGNASGREPAKLAVTPWFAHLASVPIGFDHRRCTFVLAAKATVHDVHPAPTSQRGRMGFVASRIC